MTDQNESKSESVTKSKAPGSKISLPEVTLKEAQSAIAELKSRGADVKIEDLFEEIFSSLDRGYFNSQVERLTPPSYFLELAKAHPELLKSLILQAKRGIQQIQNGESLKVPKRPGPKPKNSSSESPCID